MTIQKFTKDSLEKEGFEGFISIKSLKDTNCKDVPEERGVYVVIFPLTYVNSTEELFSEKGTGGHFKNINPNVLISELKAKWIPNCQVIYIGQAGGKNPSRTLRKRLNQYMKFGCRKPVSHWGGRFIWQIKNVDDCLIGWKKLPNENPYVVESKMIDDFCKVYNKRPFANRNKGNGILKK